MKVTERNEQLKGIAHSKCNKDIRIGVTAACKEFGMKITGRGSIAGCESSNLIDIPIICDVLQSIGLFEDSSFPNPSDKIDKAEKAERKAAKKAAALLELQSSQSTGMEAKDEISKDCGADVVNSDATKNSLATVDKASTVRKKKKTIASPSADSIDPSSKTESMPSHEQKVTDTTIPPSTLSTADSSNVAQSIGSHKENKEINVQKYAPCLIDIESVLTQRWNHQLRDYLSDMQKRKTPYHYHAADGISVEGVAMVASYVPTLPPSKASSKSAPKIPKISSKNRKNGGNDENDSAYADTGTKVKKLKAECSSTSSSSKLSSTNGSGVNEKSGQKERVSVVVDKSSNVVDIKRPLSVITTTDDSSNSGRSNSTVDIMSSESSSDKGTGHQYRKDGSSQFDITSISQQPSQRPYALSASNSAKKNKAIKATKRMMKGVVPFELSATPRQTPVSASSLGAGRRPLDKFRESNGSGEQLNLQDANDTISAVGGNTVESLKVVHDIASTSKMDGTTEKSKKVSTDQKDIDKKSKKIKLKYINTDHNDGYDSSDMVSSTSSKKGKRKDLLNTTGGTATTPPILPPRIGSGGVGGTTTGYTISHALLKPSITNNVGTDAATTSGQLSGAQDTFLDPPRALQNWSRACYDEGLALDEEEKLIRYISGLCELSVPNSPLRIGTRYLSTEFKYFDELNRLKALAAVLDEKEEAELKLRDALIQAHGLRAKESAENIPVPTKRRKMSSGNSTGSGGNSKKKDRSMSELETESPMMHSAVTLDSSESLYYEQFEGEEFARITDPNVSLTASMLWQRAQSNAVYNPTSATQQGIVDVKHRPKREKKDFFESYISQAGGQSIAAVVSTTLASVAGLKSHQQSDDDFSGVVSDQVEKIKKGSKSSAINITTLHPGALQAIDVHGVVSCPVSIVGQPAGGLKRQRSLSNMQLQNGVGVVAPTDVRSTYLADTIGGYPTKNTVPQLIIPPSLFAPASKPVSSPKYSKKSRLEESQPLPDNSSSHIHTCPFSGRLSLPDLTVYTVKMPWKMLAREFEVFDPAAMEKDSRLSSYPRTPTSLPPTSPRFPISSMSSTAVSTESTGTTSNLNGPMGIWVPAGDVEPKKNSSAKGLRITAPQHSIGMAQVRRRRKRNSDGVLVEVDSDKNESTSPRAAGTPGSMSAQTTGPREFRRIAFSDVVAPSFRLVSENESGTDNNISAEASDDEDEDISDEAILMRHEATLTRMRDRWKAIQDLKDSLKKPTGGGTGGDDDGATTGGTSKSSQSNKNKRKAGTRPPTPKSGSKKVSTPIASSSPKIPKYAIVENGNSSKIITSKVMTRRSKSPTVRLEGVAVEESAPQQPRKRGRPVKLTE